MQGARLGVWGGHSLTLSHIPKNMKCDSQPSHLAHTFTSPCFGREPKVRIATTSANDYQSTQDFKQIVVQGLQMNQMNRKKITKTPNYKICT